MEETFRTGTQSHACLELHATVARFDGERLTVHASTQNVFHVMELLAKRYKMKHENIRVIADHVGGGFGSKGALGVETTAAIDVAREAEAPVRIAFDRHEELSVSGYRPAAELKIALLPSATGVSAQRELDRSRKAYELGAYSELQALKAEDSLEKATFAFAQAKMSYESQPELNKFDVDSKKALLDRQRFMVTDLKRQVEALTVRSPVAGQIGQVQVPDRASIAKDAPLLTVVDLSALEVEIKIPESMTRDLRPGMKADLEGDGRHWQGTLSGVSPEVVNGQVTARLRFGDDRPAGLRQSQRLTVRILIDRRDNVLMVDRGGFVDQEGGGFVYLVHDDVAERHPVHLGAASIAKVEILEGLAEGDRIVINGTDAFNNADRAVLTH